MLVSSYLMLLSIYTVSLGNVYQNIVLLDLEWDDYS